MKYLTYVTTMSFNKQKHTSRRESQNRRPLSQCPVDPSGQSLAYSMGDSMTARAEEPLMPANTSRDIRGHQRLAMEKP